MDDHVRELIAQKVEWAEKRDHYALLGVATTASVDAIREAYEGLARRLHPDRVKNPEVAAMAARVRKALVEAREVLVDPKRRTTYDDSRRAAVVSVPRVEADHGLEVEIQRLLLTPTAALGDKRPQAAKVLHQKGAYLFSKGDYHGAERYLRRAIELDSTVAVYHLRLGWNLYCNQALAPQRRLKESREHIDAAVAMDPVNSEARYALACYWRDVGQMDRYRHELEAAVRGRPKHSKAELELKALGSRSPASSATPPPEKERPSGSWLRRLFGGNAA